MYYGNNIKKQMLELKAKMKPGCEFEYLSCNTQLLSMVIEKATGKTLTEYASEKLWGPLGACHNALWSLDKTNGSEKAYCCFNTNARDFARIGQLILDTGKVGNHQILPASFVEKIYTPDTLLIDIKLNKPNKRYSHNFWVSKYNNTPLVYARGIGGQCIIILPAYDMVIVRLGEKRDSVGPDGHPKDIYQFARIATQLMN
jgi:CubicO group peptidase (beta-lactamase class C family)